MLLVVHLVTVLAAVQSANAGWYSDVQAEAIETFCHAGDAVLMMPHVRPLDLDTQSGDAG